SSRWRPIVVGFDGSSASVAAATAAAGLARRELKPVRLVLALPDEVGREPFAAAAGLDAVRELLQAQMPALPLTAAIRRGPPDVVLLDESRTASLLVLGAGGRPGTELGPVAGSVRHAAACPLLLHRPLPPDGVGVVAGVDGGTSATEVLDVAAVQARVRGTSLLVVHRPSRPPHEGSSAARRWDVDACRPLVEQVALLQRGWPGLQITLQVSRQDPVHRLLCAARTAELLVIGRREPDAAGTRSTGPVVAARAAIPVLVVPAPTVRPALDRERARRHAVALAR
ncbi:MAG: universal stress protein, partial [Actinomycetes bacterium]